MYTILELHFDEKTATYHVVKHWITHWRNLSEEVRCQNNLSLRIFLILFWALYFTFSLISL